MITLPNGLVIDSRALVACAERFGHRHWPEGANEAAGVRRALKCLLEQAATHIDRVRSLECNREDIEDALILALLFYAFFHLAWAPRRDEGDQALYQAVLHRFGK